MTTFYHIFCSKFASSLATPEIKHRQPPPECEKLNTFSTMNKTVSGKENLYFEMESKAPNNGQAYDVVVGESISPATKQKTFEKQGTENNKQASMQPAHPCTQPDGVVFQRLLCIVTAVVVVSFLTAAATLVLALMLMMSRNTPTALTDCVTAQGEPGMSHSVFFLPSELL